MMKLRLVCLSSYASALGTGAVHKVQYSTQGTLFRHRLFCSYLLFSITGIQSSVLIPFLGKASQVRAFHCNLVKQLLADRRSLI